MVECSFIILLLFSLLLFSYCHPELGLQDPLEMLIICFKRQNYKKINKRR